MQATLPTNRAPFARIQHIHERLRAGQPVTAKLIARELETSARTIQRDIDFMRDQLGLPIAYEPERHTSVYTRPVESALFGQPASQPPRTVGSSEGASTGGLRLDEEPAEQLAVICERHGLRARDVLRAVIGNTLADAVCDSTLMATLVRTARSLAVLDEREPLEVAA